jgi:hypothetical protein
VELCVFHSALSNIDFLSNDKQEGKAAEKCSKKHYKRRPITWIRINTNLAQLNSRWLLNRSRAFDKWSEVWIAWGKSKPENTGYTAKNSAQCQEERHPS